MKKKNFDKFIMLFLLIQPLLDCITSRQIRNNSNLFSIGTFFRGIFFIIVILYLFFNKYKRKAIVCFAIYIILALSYQYFYTENSILAESFNFLKTFYLPFLIYFFSKYELDKIDNKFITILYLIYVNCIAIPYLFSFGYRSYEITSDKKGYIGLFYGGNEVSAILVCLLPIVIEYCLQKKNIVLGLILAIETIFASILLGTKAIFLGIIIVIGYFICRYLINAWKENKQKFTKLLFIPITLLIIIILVFPKLPVYNNLKVSLNYYEVYKWTDLLSIKSIDNIIFSTRLSYLENVHHHYIEQKPLGLLFGLGDDKTYSIKDVEIDIFDIFYKVGIVGFTLWLFLMIDGVRKQKLKGVYLLSFILFITISLFSGHILLKPMVSIYIALLFLLNKNALQKENRKKRVKNYGKTK